MKTLLENLQQKLSEITELKYIDENWGQLDYYSPNMPVQWPCCLIDLQNAQFSNISKNINKRPRDRQNATINIELTLANIRLTNTSYKAPAMQKENAWKLFDLIEKIHKTLHGSTVIENGSKLLRTSFGRMQRDDGVQEYKIVYETKIFRV